LGAIDRLLVLLHGDGGQPPHAQPYAFRFIHESVVRHHLCSQGARRGEQRC
jgi:hypothetical protein